MSRILLLEDNLSLINGLTFAFQKTGFELDIARTVKEADTASGAFWICVKRIKANFYRGNTSLCLSKLIIISIRKKSKK